MRYFVIAGEASGDIHAAQLIKSLRKNDTAAEFIFFGGDLMATAAETKPVVHYREMAFMGFIEVAKHLPAILGFMRTARHCIDSWHPDAVILVDYPSFNLKVARYAASRGLKTFYFISPKVWAWKEHRVKQIKAYITELYSILPFEPDYFSHKHGYHVEYVGNPTVKEIAEAKRAFSTEEQFRKDNSIESDLPIVAIVPGSRRKEIADNLPVMIRACESLGNVLPVIAGAPSVECSLYTDVLQRNGCNAACKILFGKSFEIIHHARAALVTSGTATLETAVIGTPQVVCYRMNGSPLLYNLYKRMLKVHYVSLPNLIVDAPIVKELLLHHCSVDNIIANLRPLIGDSRERKDMLSGYASMMKRLGSDDCTATAAMHIVSNLKKQ